MGELLLISDDPRRAERLARNLAPFGPCQILDLYEEAVAACAPELVVSDVAALTSEAVVRLRRILSCTRRDGVPYLFIAHGNAARAEAQARILGASDTLGTGAVASLLLKKLAALSGQLKPDRAAVRALAGEARLFLREVFFSGAPVTPDLIENGTTLVTKAIGACGVRDWVEEVRRFDDATHQHCLLVAGLAAAFGTSLGLARSDNHRLTKAALLHDVGKTKIPTAILNKPGKLDAAEMAVMKTHPAHGHAMLGGRGFEDLLLTVVRSHHEMLDGSGYPDGLRAGRIPDLVRLVTVCDIYGALIERRAYKPPMPGEAAFAILEGMVGRLDGDLVRSFRPIVEATRGNELPRGFPDPYSECATHPSNATTLMRRAAVPG